MAVVMVGLSQESRGAYADDSAAAPRRPNVVLLFADDLGYGDVGTFGAADIKTPNIDKLAAEGTRFTNFYVAQPVCTASRAALMTGCYSNRVGLFGALNHESRIGIAADELLLPEMLKSKGYATAAFGKWHLGVQPELLPTRHGFDEFFGIPYSNDNGPLHGSQKGVQLLHSRHVTVDAQDCVAHGFEPARQAGAKVAQTDHRKLLLGLRLAARF